MKTNRDLYIRIGKLIQAKSGQAVPALETYLTNLVRNAERFADREALNLNEFFSLLSDSFEEFKEPRRAPVYFVTLGFKTWKEHVEHQIADLRQMSGNGQLQNELRFFGISAPSGEQWYNFDPCAYIECGMAGSLGGWVEGDGTGRSYVPGQVACLDAEGNMTPCDPRDLDRPPIEIPVITWEKFSEFASCGQTYE